MSIQIQVKRAARKALIETAIKEWRLLDPKGVKKVMQYIREITAQDIKSSGQYEGDTGFIQFRLPKDLFWILRAVIPGWGDDDADIKELVTMFPDMMPREMKQRLRGTGNNRRRI